MNGFKDALRWIRSAEVGVDLKALIALSWPVIVARLGVTLMGTVDTIAVGHFSADELAYHGLAWAASSVFLITGIGLLMGVQVKTAHFVGANDLRATARVARRGQVYGFQLGMISLILLILAAVYLLPMIVTENLAKGARDPLILFGLMMPVYLMTMAGSQTLEGLGKTRETLVATLLANGVNLIFLLILVPGVTLPIIGEVRGALGAAMATFIARLFQWGLVSAILYFHSQEMRLGLLNKAVSDHSETIEQRQIGFAAGGSLFIEVLAFAALSFYAGRLDELNVAAWVIVLNYATLVFMIPMGLGAGASVLVGRAFGAADKQAQSRMSVLALSVAALIMIVVCVMSYLFAVPIAGIYSHDLSVQKYVTSAIILSCLFFIPDGVQVVAASALRARKDIVWPTIIHYISYGLIMMPLGYLFCIILKGGLLGLVWAVIVASWVSGPLLVMRTLRLNHKLSA
jgi:multidrug resistance protein, MATE family